MRLQPDLVREIPCRGQPLTSTPWRTCANGRTARQRVHRESADRGGVGGDHRCRADRPVPAGRRASRSRGTYTAVSSRSSSARSPRGSRPGRRSSIATTRAPCRAQGRGRDTGGRGNAAAEITAQAESLSPTSTRCVVTTKLHITGRVAQFEARHPRRRIEEADGPVRQQPQHDARRPGHRRRTTATRASPVPPDGSSAASSADPAVQLGSADLALGQALSSRTATAGAQDRGPATEPVDLAGVAGRRSSSASPHCSSPSPSSSSCSGDAAEPAALGVPASTPNVDADEVASPSCSAGGRPVATKSPVATPALPW